MASLCRDGGKKYRILFMKDGHRKQIKFSGFTQKQAVTLHNVVERLIANHEMRTAIDPEDATWLSRLSDNLYGRLARHGLVPMREPVAASPTTDAVTLKQFLQDHIAHGRTSQGKPAAESTLAKWRGTQTFLNELFPGRDLTSITAEDAHQFRVWLDKRRIKQTTSPRNGEPMAENAKRKHIANCKMFFNAAKRRGLVDGNPFEAQVSGTQANRSRDHYVTPDETAAILEAATDPQSRLLIALWRLAGLRKMEVFNLKWGDVNWEQGKLLVRSTKTKHHEGCDVRYTPIRDVRPYLEDAFEAALSSGKRSMPANTPIVTRFSTTNNNLDKPLKLVIEKAGLVPWPKLFQNMRASCETQWLKEGERPDLVANWMGHSVKVQRQNYVQQTADDIERFNSKPAFTEGAQIGAQHTPESDDMPGRASQDCAPSLANSCLANENAGEEYPEQDSNLQPAA